MFDLSSTDSLLLFGLYNCDGLAVLNKSKCENEQTQKEPGISLKATDFPKKNKLHAIFNRNTIKFYFSPSQLINIINFHNTYKERAKLTKYTSVELNPIGHLMANAF